MRIKSYNLPLLNCCKVAIAFLFLSGFTSGGFDGEGIATITPTESILLEKGEYTIKFVVGEHGIAVGGGIKTRFPKRWRSQIDNPAKDNYLKVNLSSKSSGYKIVAKNRDLSLDGQREGQSYIITITITKKPLIKGDTISLNFIRIKSKCNSAYNERLPCASDVDGDGNFAFIKGIPVFTIQPGPPEKLYTISPTIQQKGKSFYLKVAVLDRCQNAAVDYKGTVLFTSSDNMAKLPGPYTFSKNDGGVRNFPVVLNTPGYHTITINDKSRNQNAVSNPIECKNSEPEQGIWWGDIHSHSEISADGIGNGSFEYARDVACLDFYSLTDHFKAVKNHKWNYEWDRTKKNTMEFYQPGRFVTILGYEVSMKTPSGHNNVYFNSTNKLIPQIPRINSQYFMMLNKRKKRRRNILKVWEYLEQKLPQGVDAITIPHHTGLVFANSNKTFVSFDKPYRNPQMRVAIEIFSKHGTSEKYDPAGPLSYKNWIFPMFEPVKKSLPHLHLPKNGPYYAQDAWAKKRYLGTIASTDNHSSHPGMPGPVNVYNPLVAAYAKILTRDAIFNAIKARRTYATTGERIILDFTVNSHPMGSRVELEKGSKPKISVVARGTDVIDFVEVLKWDFSAGKYDSDGHPIYEALLHKKINSMDVKLEFVDDNYKNGSLYYLRLKQLQTITDNQAWAWSSPIWVSYEN